MLFFRAGSRRFAPPAGMTNAPKHLLTLTSVGMPMAVVLTVFVLVAYLAPMTARRPDNTSKPKRTFSPSETTTAWSEWSRLNGKAAASFMAGVAFPPIVSSYLDNAKADLLRGEVGAANWAMRIAARRAAVRIDRRADRCCAGIDDRAGQAARQHTCR